MRAIAWTFGLLVLGTPLACSSSSASSGGLDPSQKLGALSSTEVQSLCDWTAKAEGASREEFAKAIALYACKYNKNENVQRERIKRDGDRFDKLWKISRSA